MKKQVLFSIVFLFALVLSATAQDDFYHKPLNQVVKDKTIGRDILLGPCNEMGLKTNSLFAPAFNFEYKSYTPNAAIINSIKKKLRKTRITLVFGSWCGDSKLQVGRFYKILDEAGYPGKYVTALAVNRKLKAPGTKVDRLDIQRVPTFIVFHKGKEVGRITESPKTTLEGDLAAILKKVN
ncbi:MAG: thioredoxin family protein [Bacteroidales bacterium]|nr:thioredoxin family protein [Bacteroidales bacterium]